MIIKNLKFSYDSTLLFDNFNFESNYNITALKGPSGCGKTTLLKIISKNLSPQSCSHIQFNDNTFCVIQEDSLLPWLSGEDNILRFVNISKGDIQTHELFPLMQSFILKKAFEMSFGQRRMIELFRAILSNPDLLLLDEPFNFLDKKNRHQITKSLLKLSENKCEIICTSHYYEDLSDLGAAIFYFDGLFPVKELKAN